MNLYYKMFHTETPEALINLYLSQNRRESKKLAQIKFV